MKIAFFNSVKDNVPKYEDLTEKQFVDLITTPVETENKKSVRLWSPTLFNGTRDSNNASEVQFQVIDIDKKPEAEIEQVLAKIAGAGHKVALHTSISNEPPNAACYRLIVFLDKPIPAHKFKAFWRKFEEQFLPVGFADPASGDAARMYYLPSHKPGRKEFFQAALVDGSPYPVDTVLSSIPDHPRAEVIIAPNMSITMPDEVPVEMDWIREQLKTVKSESRKFLSACLKGTGFEEKQHDNSLKRLASIVGKKLPSTVPPAAIVELFRPCFAATPWGEGTEHMIGEFLKKLQPVREQKAEEEQRKKLEETAFTVINEIVSKKQKGKPITEEEVQLLDNKWEGALTRHDVKMPDGSILSMPDETLLNVCTILRLHPDWKDTLSYDVRKGVVLFDQSPIVVCDAPDVTITRICSWFQEHYHFKFRESDIKNQVMSVAREREIDPFNIYLEGLTWDEVPRIGKMATDYIKSPSEGDVLKFENEAFKLALIGAARMSFQPGLKFDNAIILEGPQGSRKTTMVSDLGGEFFAQLHTDLDNKDTLFQCVEFALLELPELKSFQHAGPEKLKDFLSRQKYNLRRPYSMFAEQHLRRAIFIGTTNKDDYLSDTTGNRRYWIIRTGEQIDTDAVLRDRDQLWAEAYHLAKTTRHADMRADLKIIGEFIADSKIDDGGLVHDVPEKYVEYFTDLNNWTKVPKNPAEVHTFNWFMHLIYNRGAHQAGKGKSDQLKAALLQAGFKQVSDPKKGYVAPTHIIEACNAKT